MAVQGFFDRVAGKWKRVLASVTGTANAIPAGDTTGRLDSSWMPVGIGPEVIPAVALENLTAGHFVNLLLSGGVLKVQRANGTDNTKPADGFVLDTVSSAATVNVYLLSQTNTAMTGLTIGVEYYLDTATPGGVTATPPAANGNWQQRLGKAVKTTELTFDGGPADGVEMTA